MTYFCQTAILSIRFLIWFSKMCLTRYREVLLLPRGQILKQKQRILFYVHQWHPTGFSENTILKLISRSHNIFTYIYIYIWIQGIAQCSCILLHECFSLQGPTSSVIFPCTDRDDCNYILSVDSLQYQNRFVIHQPTRCPHMHRHALQTHTHIQRVEAHNSYVHTSLVISSDGTQLISNSTNLCFQLWI